MKRRDFLRTGGAIIVSFAFDGALPNTSSAQISDLGKPVDPREVDSFLAIHRDGSVTIYTSKVDVGTGLRIAMSQMVAEELDIPVDRVTLVEGDTAITPNHGGTGGSTGIPQGGVELRRAAATARQALMKLGAQPGTNIGALAGGKRLNLKVDPNAPLKDPKTYTIVGRPILRPDVPDKCTGRNVYVQDFSLPGMLHGRVIHPPSIGAKLMSLDESSIRTIPGARVVRIQNFLGIVAPDEWAAIRAAKELKVTWTEEQGLPGSDNLDRHVRESVPDHDETIVNKGDPAAALPGTTKQLSALYAWPIQSHASLGPSCAVADVRPEGTTIWTASQGPHGLRRNLAKIFGIPEDKLRVIFLDASGSYGTNGGDDAAADALLLSKTVGRPVRLSNLRAPGKIANVFAVESFTDELAAAAGADPVAFRLRVLTDPRAIDVLKRATEMLDWQARPSPNPHPAQDNMLTGRGVAYARYHQRENSVAMAMEVAVDPASGRIGVRGVTCGPA